jgi:valyl-tRNA synthetase
MVGPWPHIQEQIIDREAEDRMNVIFETITTIRNVRQELGIAPLKEVAVVISTTNKENKELFETLSSHIKNLSRLSSFKIQAKYVHIKSSITTILKDTHVSMLLSGIVDIANEKIKIEERIQRIESEIKTKKKMLGNKEFLKKAPIEVVEKEKGKLQDLNSILKRLKGIRDELR